MIKTLLRKIIHLKYFNRWVIFFADLFFSVCCTAISLFLTDWILAEYRGTTVYSDKIWVMALLLSVGYSSVSFLCFQTYKGVIRHASFVEAGRFGMATALKVLAWIPTLYLITGIKATNVLLLSGGLDFFLTFFVLIFSRVILIYLYTYIVNSIQNNVHNKEHLLIFDTGLKSVAFAGSAFQNMEETYALKGLVRVGNGNQLRINNHPVYSVHDQKSFNTLVNRLYIKAILFPDDATVRKESERFVRFCEKKKVRMLIMPELDVVQDKKINFRNLPEVKIEDLLEREEITINLEEIADSLADKTVLVTGAAGSIGSELCRLLCCFGLKELVLLDSAETPMHSIRLELEEKFPDVKLRPIMGDVRNKKRVQSVFQRFHPQIVFHAAAYKHVPLMEENPCEAVRTNVLGTMIVADVAVDYEVEKFVMISTDKAVNPTNVMGASKRMAEIYIQSLGLTIAGGQKKGNTRFVTTRFGNVLGSNGSVIPRFREQLAKGGPLTVTHPEIIRYFMTIPEACRLVLEAGTMGEGNEIFVFDMGAPVKISDLARRMIELAGLEPDKDVRIEYTGLRPGEKLFEELLASKENTLPTMNKKIFRATVREYDYEEIREQILVLCETAKEVNLMETVRQMKQLIPEFRSQQSKYECLDQANSNIPIFQDWNEIKIS